MSSPCPALRNQVMRIYKGNLRTHILTPWRKALRFDTRLELLYLGREYPQGYEYYRTRLHRAFISQKDLKDEEKIKAGIKRAEFVKKEIEALYYLKRYRTLRQRYDPIK